MRQKPRKYNNPEGWKSYPTKLRLITKLLYQVGQRRQRTAEPVKVEVAQLCPNLCKLIDYRIHGILQARILEWVAFPFSRGSSQPRD